MGFKELYDLAVQFGYIKPITEKSYVVYKDDIARVLKDEGNTIIIKDSAGNKIRTLKSNVYPLIDWTDLLYILKEFIKALNERMNNKFDLVIVETYKFSTNENICNVELIYDGKVIANSSNPLKLIALANMLKSIKALSESGAKSISGNK